MYEAGGLVEKKKKAGGQVALDIAPLPSCFSGSTANH
jgi:hypothetical protein